MLLHAQHAGPIRRFQPDANSISNVEEPFSQMSFSSTEYLFIALPFTGWLGVRGRRGN
jgi:hypothetical protein